jgi:hypothetical protein
MIKTTALSTAALAFSSVSQAQRKLPDVEVKMHNGRPTVFVGGKPTALATYSNFGQSYLKDTMKFFMNIGMDMYHLQIANLPTDYNGSRFWVGDTIDKKPLMESSDKIYDVDEQAKFILDGDPDGYLFIRFVLRPPASWRDKHAAEYFITDIGTVHDTPSLASDTFWEAAAKFSAAVVGYVESTSWAEHVAGYGNFHHTEGVHMPVGDGWFFDHNPLMVQKLRDFLRNKYGTVEKLRAAYGDKLMTFENADVPKDKLRGTVPDVTQMLYFQTGTDNQGLRDYLELTRDLFHKRFRQLGEAMSGAADRKMVFLHDALKQTMLGWNHWGFFTLGYGDKISWNPAFPEFMAGSGHIDVAALDGVPGFNGLVTPHDYQARGIGGVYEPEGIVDSMILRGLYFSCEMDTRFTSKRNEIGACRNIKETETILWRNLATGFARGFNSYWQWGFAVDDWFYSPKIHDLINYQANLMRRSLDWKHETMPGIAMLLDDSAVLETNGSGNFINEANMWEQKMGMARCGVPHRIYLFEDLELDNFPKHRVFYFPNLFRVDDKRMAILKEKVFRDGNIIIWGPGSGISDGKKIGKESASRLTGFEFTMIPANAQRRIIISNFEHPITKDLDESMIIGGPLPYGPVIMPTDGTELGFAWAKGGMNHIGMSIKEFGKGAAQSREGISSRGKGDYAAIFITAVQIPANLWRSIARYAGAHIYSESNDLLMANNCIVAAHSLKSGRKIIKLPERSKVTELNTEKVFSQGTKEIIFTMKAPDTRVFLIE